MLPKQYWETQSCILNVNGPRSWRNAKPNYTEKIASARDRMSIKPLFNTNTRYSQCVWGGIMSYITDIKDKDIGFCQHYRTMVLLLRYLFQYVFVTCVVYENFWEVAIHMSEDCIYKNITLDLKNKGAPIMFNLTLGCHI